MSDELSPLDRVKRELDELKLQAKLGRAEATDYMEAKKQEMSQFIDETRHELDDIVSPAREKTTALRQALDELKLKLELGRMDSRDAYEEQQKNLERALGNVWKRFAEIEGASGEAFLMSKKAFVRQALLFAAKMELLGLKLSAGRDTSEKEMEHRNAELTKDLGEWIGFLESAADEAKVDSRESWESLVDKIRRCL